MTLHPDRERQDGDLDPFISLYRAEYPGMVRLAHALTGGVESAEDVVQDAFSRMQPRLGDLEQPGAYLRTTVVNLSRDHTRRKRHQHRVDATWRMGISVSDSSGELLDVLMALPYRQRAVLVMRYWGDWSEAEIAQALGCRPGSVKALASRGLTKLHKELPS